MRRMIIWTDSGGHSMVYTNFDPKCEVLVIDECMSWYDEDLKEENERVEKIFEKGKFERLY